MMNGWENLMDSNKKKGGVGVWHLKIAIVVALLFFALGSYVANETWLRPERPMMRWISRAARLGLRLLIFADPPAEEARSYKRVDADSLDHHRSL